MWKERPYLDGASKDPSVRVIQNGLVNRLDAKAKVDALRAMPKPHGVSLLVGGTPALEQDSVATISAKLPMMILIAVSMTTILMFLAFGSLVLPIKAALMNALTLCSTLGVLTWIFVDGHLRALLNFTPTPLTAPVIGLIIAVIFGLSTDYEVFLVSRMVEARARGMTTEEAIRNGTATTGRLISAAALVLVVVGGAFAFSDLVMMQYLAIGLITALLLDATVVRMFLVPSVMKLLGNDCWWAPRWMKRVQERIGLSEIALEDERNRREGGGAAGRDRWPSERFWVRPRGRSRYMIRRARPRRHSLPPGEPPGWRWLNGRRATATTMETTTAPAASEEATIAEELTIGDIEDAERDGAGDDDGESPGARDRRGSG